MCIKDIDKIYRKVSLKPLNVRVTAMEDLQIIALVTTIYKHHNNRPSQFLG